MSKSKSIKDQTRCNRGTCKGLMQDRGYGKDRYQTCCICGHLRYVHPIDQKQFTEAQELCKMRDAAEL